MKQPIRTVYECSFCQIEQVSNGNVEEFRCRARLLENYSTSLDKVIEQSQLTEEQKTIVKNDLNLTPQFM